MSLTIYVTDAKNICYQRQKVPFLMQNHGLFLRFLITINHKTLTTNHLSNYQKNGHISNQLQSFLKKRLKIGGKFRKFTTKQELAPAIIKWNEFIQIFI